MKVYNLRDDVMEKSMSKKKTGTLYDGCNDHIGAIGFLAKACSYPDNAFKRMIDNNILGEDLYILYHNCCSDNVLKALFVMTNWTIKDIKKAIEKKILIDDDAREIVIPKKSKHIEPNVDCDVEYVDYCDI